MTESDILKEAERIVSSAQNQGITLRLFGGTAIALRCPAAMRPNVSRKYKDIDLMGFRKQNRELERLFPQLGYQPEEMFNALRGGSRLMFFDLERNRRVDLFLNYLEMCHKIDLKDRLTLDQLTIPMADLLATKLQIVETNEKDFKDIIAILLDHDVVESDQPNAINGKRLAELCASDWGIYKTFTIVIGKTIKTIDSYDLTLSERDILKNRLKRISQMIEDEPKNVKWKFRANVGERVRWYMLPDETDDEMNG